jgi:hypothetical protein
MNAKQVSEAIRKENLNPAVIEQDLQRFLSQANPKVLKNHRCRVLFDKTGKGPFTELTAKSDGSYLYDVLSIEFSAVMAFWTYNIAAEIYEEAGFKNSTGKVVDIKIHRRRCITAPNLTNLHLYDTEVEDERAKALANSSQSQDSEQPHSNG